MEQRQPRWLSVCGEEGKYTLTDDFSGETFSFTCNDETITEMYQIEPIVAPEGDGDVLGYKYRLQENGKWGFISKGFLQFTATVYDGIIPIKDHSDWSVAAYHSHNSQVSINISSQIYLDNMLGEHRLVEIIDMYGEKDVPNCFKYLPQSQFVPTEHALIERNYIENTGVVLYRPDKDKPMAVINYRTPEGWTRMTLYWENNTILARKPSGEVMSVPAVDLSFESCCNILMAEN